MISVQYKGLQSAHQNLYATVESRNQCTIMSFNYNATIGAATTANLFKTAASTYFRQHHNVFKQL